VSVKLFGENGTSGGVRHLHRPGSFQRGSRDVFVVANDRALGRLSRLTVWHDNAGTTPGWYLSRISVRDLQTNDCYHFIADSWLTLSTLGEHGDIEKELHRLGKNNLCSRDRHLDNTHFWVYGASRNINKKALKKRKPTSRITSFFRCFAALLILSVDKLRAVFF